MDCQAGAMLESLAGRRPEPEVYHKALREKYRTWLAEVRRMSPPIAQLRSGSTGR
jgi:hypothetical protein